MRLDDPEVVRREYASEERFAVRSAVWAQAEGPDVRDVLLGALAEASPRRVLEVGCGFGELAERAGCELRAEVVALDLSARMVELARRRGVDARLGDIQRLPFADASFDCALAAFMLYHVPDLDRGLAELARVLRPDGRLVAATSSGRHLSELWDPVGGNEGHELSFTRENGEDRLRRHFVRVERRDVDSTLVFPDYVAARRYVEATVSRAHLAERLPRFEGPLRARRSVSVFVAERSE